MIVPNFDDLWLFLLICCLGVCITAFGLGILVGWYFF